MNKILKGDALEVLKTLPDESVDCVITSPPYWALRDYGVDGQLGLEPTFQAYINKLCDIFDEVKRVLKKEGTCWVNIGDTYMGNSSYSAKGRQGFGNDKVGMINKKQWLDPKNPTPTKLRAREHVESGQIIEKSLCQIPSRFAIEMTNRGWILRNEIIWHKPNCMPSSVEDRFTVDFEKIFFFVKSKKYYFEQQLDPLVTVNDPRMDNGRESYNGKYSGREDAENFNSPRARTQRKTQKAFVTLNSEGKNKRTTWSINTKGYSEAHFATYPEKLVEPMIKAGCPKDGVVLDIFMGSGTTAIVALQLDRKYLGIELNEEYIQIAEDRILPYKNKLF